MEDWEARKRSHINALYANTNYDDPDNHREERIQELEVSYDEVKDMLWGVVKERSPEEDTAFMKAGRRSLAAILPPKMPGEDSISRLPERR